MLENQRYLDIGPNWTDPDAPSQGSVATTGRLAPSRSVIAERVVPELLARLDANDHPEIISSTLIALARSTTEHDGNQGKAHAVLREHLRHGQQKVRESAVLGLGLLGNLAGGNDLSELLGTETPSWLRAPALSVRTRAFAAHGLGLAALRVQDPEARRRWAQALVDELESPGTDSVTFQIAAIEALGLISLDGESAAKSDSKNDSQMASADSLAEYLASWVEVAPRRSAWVRSHAGVAAGKAAAHAGPSVRTAIVTQLTRVIKSRKNHGYIRTGAAMGLGEAANSGNGKVDQRAREALVSLMKSGQALESRFARMALVEAAARPGEGEEPFAGERAARRALLSDLKRSRSDEIGWTALALGSLDWRLHQAGVTTGRETAMALAEFGRKRRGDDSSAALGLGLSLAVQGTKAARTYEEHLLEEFESISSPVRKSFMALALGMARSPGVKDVLLDQIKGQSAHTPLLWNASVALTVMNESVEDELKDMVAKKGSTIERRAAVRALGQAGGARSIDLLLKAAADESEQDLLRAEAIDALAALCDDEPITWRDAYSHALPYFAATPTLNGSGNDSAIIERPW